MPRTLRIAAAAIGSVVAFTAVGACTASGGGGAVSGSNAGGAGVAAAPAGRPSHAEAGAATKSAPAASYANARDLAVEIGTAKIRIASMTVQVKRGATVAGQADQAEAITMGASGEVDSDDRTSGSDAVATLVLRVPPDQLTPTLTQLSKLGDEKSRRLSTQDVTAKVADVNSRVSSARAAIARIRVLYARAHKISDVINLESELSTRESDLEALQAQQRALATETATASITLTLTTPPKKVKHVPPPKPKHHDNGFVAGLRGGWHAFVTGLVVVSTVLGAILPFLILLAFLALVARIVWPRLRPTRTTAPGGPTAP